MTNWKAYIQPPRQGAAHIREGVPCQDGAAMRENDARIACALADGLSQRPRSEYAANAAVQAAAEFLLDADLDGMGHDALKAELINVCRDAVRRNAADHGLNLEEMDCTLLFAVLFRDGSRCITGQLGDGAVCVLSRDSSLLVEAADEKRRMGAGFTNTLMSTDALELMSISEHPLDDAAAFLLTTDGLEKEVYSRSSKVKKQAAWYVNLISQQDADVCRRSIDARWDQLAANASFGFEDDKSLAVIVRYGVQVNLPEDPTWLCACGERSRLESTYCEYCGKDFMKVYKGVNCKRTHGSKRAFFLELNQDEAAEKRLLQTCCVYPLAFDVPETVEDAPPAMQELPKQMAADMPGPPREAIPSDMPVTSLEPDAAYAPPAGNQGYAPVPPQTPPGHRPVPPELPASGEQEVPVHFAPAEPHSTRLRSSLRHVWTWLRAHWMACCLVALLVTVGLLLMRIGMLWSENAQLSRRMLQVVYDNDTMQMEHSRLSIEYRDLQMEIERLTREVTVLRERLETTSGELSGALMERQRLIDANAGLASELAALKDAVPEREAELRLLQSRVSSLSSDKAAMKTEIDRLNAEVQRIQREYDVLRMQWDAVESVVPAEEASAAGESAPA